MPDLEQPIDEAPLTAGMPVQTEGDMAADETEAADMEEGAMELPPLTWQATEYVQHHKSGGWYAGLGGVVLVLVVVAYIFHLWLSIGVFLAMGAAIAVYAHKPPRVLTYELNEDGVTIEGKQYPYRNFRSFGVVSDMDWHAIDLEPTQRFMPRLTILFGDDDFDVIVEHLSAYLPRADRNPDWIERLSRYLRF